MITFTSLMHTVQSAVDQAAESVTRENINSLLEYFHPLEGESSTDDKSSNDQISVADLEKMSPRMVQLQYPKMTHDGPVEHMVSVPLITLSPIPILQVSDVQVELELEMVENDGDLMVGFPQKSGDTHGEAGATVTNGGGSNANSKITLNIKANEKPSGVQALIEGYSKALRAQLPN